MQDNKLIKALVLNAQLGNNSAFEQLYQMTVQQVYALALRLSNSKVQAENLTIKTYLNAWARISLKSENVSFLPWLKKIAIESLTTENERIKQNSNNENLDGMTLSADEEKFFNDNGLEKHISQLQSKEKNVYVLHDIEKLSFTEISKLLSISEEELKDKLAQTRELLIGLTNS